MPTIAVDAMGGDHAPDEVVKGVAQVSLATDIECLLVGDERRIQENLEGVSYNPEHIAILHCRDAIGMGRTPRRRCAAGMPRCWSGHAPWPRAGPTPSCRPGT